MTPLTAELLRGLPLPRHENGDSKEGRGQVLVLGGNTRVPGAVLLAAEAALRAGAGKLQVATCRSVAVPMGLALPEAMVLGLPETEDGDLASEGGAAIAKSVSRSRSVLVGPGVTSCDGITALVGAVVEGAGDETALVLDAGALPCLGRRPDLLGRRGVTTVITPHSGEMAGLLDVEREAVDADPLSHAREAASRFGCITVLKGGSTHIVDAGGEAWRFDGGTIGLGTSGSGDVLAGVIAGLLARGTKAAEAALWGVFLHAEAGNRLTRRYGGIGFLARELPPEIPVILGHMS